MMGPSHRRLGAAWWLGGVLAANTVGAGIHPLIAFGGAAVAPVFAAGRWSPDADVTWLAHLGHRRATHRPDTTAAALTVITFVVWVPLAFLAPAGLAWLVWAPVAGWWSHLVGDAMFGRIPVGPAVGAVLARILPSGLVRRGGGYGPYWVGVGWDTDGLLERGNVRLEERSERTGLRRTVRVLPFAPTTVLLHGVSIVLGALVTWQWISQGSTVGG